MKISSASKKVLASALSAAMVVAFAPTVAFGAQDTAKLTVNYSAGSGVSQTGGSQSTIDAQQTLTVSSGKITLQAGSDLGLKSGEEYYAFDGWTVNADIDKDGQIDTTSTNHKDVAVTVAGDGITADVSPVEIESSTPLYAVAKYATASITTVNPTIDQATGKVAFTVTKDSGAIKNAASGKYVVTAPNGAVVEKALDKLAAENFALQTGKWTVALVDGNGVTIDTESVYFGNILLTGGAFKAFSWNNSDPSTQQYVTTQTVWYEAPIADTTLGAIIADPTVSANTVAYKIKADGSVDTLTTQDAFYTANGSDTSAALKAGEKGAISTAMTAYYVADGVKFASFTYDKTAGALKAATAGIGSTWITNNATGQAAVKDPAKKGVSGYYMVITDAAGKIVAETVDSGVDGATDVTPSGGTVSYTTNTAGTYTATLYKMTAMTPAGATTDAIPGSVEAVASMTAEIADDNAVAPTWTYTANADVKKGGELVFATAAGDGYVVKYGSTTGAGVSNTYDATKGGITVAQQTAQVYYFAKSNNDKATTKKNSAEIKLVGYFDALTAYQGAVAAFNTKTVNGKVGTYYASDASVKAAVAAAEKTFADAGFQQAAKATDANAKVWASVTIAAEQSTVDAVVGVAKAQLDALKAGVASADGKTVSVLAATDYDAAVSAIEAVSAAYTANHDGIDNNNVAKANDQALTNLASYVTAVDNGLKTAAGKAKSYKSEDVTAADAVSTQLAAAKTAAEAQAALEAYSKLTAEQKALVPAAAVAAAEAIVANQELVDAQDEGTLNKLTTTKKKTVALKGAAKTKKAQTVTYTTKVSKSGNAVVYAKKSGSSRITVAKAGKVTLKKGTKKGTYTAKVKATCGTQTRTVNVKFIVK